MRILDKYILKNFLLPFLYCLSVFIFLYILIDLFGHLDEILKNRTPFLILDEYYLSMIPFIIVNTAPIAALLSTIYVISMMNKYDEITAMRAAGISIFRILLPFVYIGFAISVSIFGISEKLIPFSMNNARTIAENYIQKDKDDGNPDNKAISDIALYGKNNRLIFIKNYNKYGNSVEGITILRQDKNGSVIEKTTAEKGKWIGTTWIFSNILIYRLDKNGKLSGTPLFLEEESIDIESPKNLIAKGTNYEYMSFKDLSNYIRNFSGGSKDIIHKLRVDMHQKISFPFTNLVIILIGAAFAVRIKGRKKTAAAMSIGVSIVIGFLYYVSMAAFIALGKGGILPPFLAANLANIIFGSAGILLIKN